MRFIVTSLLLLVGFLPATAQTPSVSVDSLACIPLDDNAVVNVTVEHVSGDVAVRVYFRRLLDDSLDFYYVEARRTSGVQYEAILPIAAQPAGAAVAYYATAESVSQAAPLRTLTRVAPTQTDCRSRLDEARRPFTDLLVIGETAVAQHAKPPSGWRCDGVVERIDSEGVRHADVLCRLIVFRSESAPTVLTGPPGPTGPVGPTGPLYTSPPPPTASGPQEDSYNTVEVFYGTDRLREGRASYGTRRGPLEVGTCSVSIPVDRERGELPGPSWYEFPNPERHVLLLDVMPLGLPSFRFQLSRRVADADEPSALVFIHGYNVSFEDAARRTAQIAYDVNFDGVPMMYSWPSRANMPSYTIDEANIRWTVPHLREFLEIVKKESGATTVHLIAHSMGNRALVEVLRRLAVESQSSELPLFNQIILAAPDVDKDVFIEDIAPAIRDVGQRLTIYASSRDKALFASREVHGYPRLGDMRMDVVLVDGVETVDASDVDTSFLRSIHLGHSYFSDKVSVLQDLEWVLQRWSPAQRGLEALPSGPDPPAYWKVQVD